MTVARADVVGGFASASETAAARKLTHETQSAKLRLVADVARSVWG